MQPTKIKPKPPKFMFVMFDTHVKLPPDASPIAVNKFYLLTYFLNLVRLECMVVWYIDNNLVVENVTILVIFLWMLMPSAVQSTVLPTWTIASSELRNLIMLSCVLYTKKQHQNEASRSIQLAHVMMSQHTSSINSTQTTVKLWHSMMQ